MADGVVYCVVVGSFGPRSPQQLPGLGLDSSMQHSYSPQSAATLYLTTERCLHTGLIVVLILVFLKFGCSGDVSKLEAAYVWE